MARVAGKTRENSAIRRHPFWHSICPFLSSAVIESIPHGRPCFVPGPATRRCKMFGKFCVSAVGLLLTAQLAAAAPAAAADRKDFQVAKDIATSVQRYSRFTIFDDVSAGVNDGLVTLTGKVTMPYKRDDLEKRIAKIDGVRGVNNQISVLPVSQFDDELRYRIARSIYNNSNFWTYAIMPNPPIHIVVEGGRVTLTGVVQSEVDRALARSLATQFGALSVTNELKTDAEVGDALAKSE
jgi:hyperosmotically inducible protein